MSGSNIQKHEVLTKNIFVLIYMLVIAVIVKQKNSQTSNIFKWTQASGVQLCSPHMHRKLCV